MNTMTPSSDIYWMLLSFLSLHPEQQLKHLGDVPSRQSPLARSAVRNPLLALNIALWEFHVSWWDDFYPNVKAAEIFDSELKRLGVVDADGVGIFCLEEFLDGESWKRLRELAKEALAESGIDPCPVPALIPFGELVELVDLKDIHRI
ncbi:MAG: hypothetical protein KF800_07645 [Lysobacter sp.]|nr:hypothetical protein [Lysobacter sp.]